MSVTLDGIDYDVNTPAENTKELLDYINEYCTTNQITNSEGDIIQIDATDANPLYLLLYGVGYLATTIQQLIYNNGCMLNLQAASDRQVLDIAAIAGLQLKDASYTTINAAISASLGQSCSITKDLTVTTSANGTTLVFSPAFETTIAASTTENVVLICSTTGSYSIEAGAITGFDENPIGFGSMVTSASVVGSDAETISELRARIKERGENYTMLDRAAQAINSLPGVSKCSIYFNYSPDLTTTVNTTILQPRTALLFVQGYDDDIAETYYRYLSCPTQADAEGTYVQQDYVTNAGQHIPVYIIPPTYVPVYIRVYISTSIEESEVDVLKTAITGLATSQEIAAGLTSATIINTVQSAMTMDTYSIVGAQVSLSAGMDFSISVTPEPYQLLQFSSLNIEVLTI